MSAIDGGEIVRHLRRRHSRCSTRATRRARPIVLIHCSTCSMDWWDKLAPLLDQRPPRDPDRPARPRRLGEAEAGYSIEDQASAVAEALAEARRRRAPRWSATRSAEPSRPRSREQSPQLASRVVIIDQAPEDGFEQRVPRRAPQLCAPVIGQAIERLVQIAPAVDDPGPVRPGVRARATTSRAASTTPTSPSTTCAR